MKAQLSAVQMEESVASPQSGPIITIQELNAYYGDSHILENVKMDIEAKKVQVIMGPSGCGKTTLLRILNRMNDTVPGFRVTGKVLIENRDIYSKEVDPVMLKMDVGMVFQAPNPFPISIYDNVAFGPRIHKLFRKRKELDSTVQESLQRVGLWEEVKDRLRASATRLSGGQQQRLCIARALAVHPHVLLMDEPASALDPGSTAKIEELIVDLKKNYTVVVVSHNMQHASRIANNVAFVYNGEIVEQGRSPEIFENPSHSLTEKYISGKL